MHKHDLRVLVMMDGVEVFFSAIRVEVDQQGGTIATPKYTDYNGATEDLLMIIAAHLQHAIDNVPARLPHASQHGKQNSAGFAENGLQG